MPARRLSQIAFRWFAAQPRRRHFHCRDLFSTKQMLSLFGARYEFCFRHKRAAVIKRTPMYAVDGQFMQWALFQSRTFRLSFFPPAPARTLEWAVRKSVRQPTEARD
jgi:hypothetical protein